MSVDSSPDLDKILYRSMSVDSSPDFDKISTCDPIFRKNGYVKSQWEKIFEFEIFVLKYVLDHSESIPTKKFLSLPFFRPKMAKNRGFLKIFGRKKFSKKKNFSTLF